MGEVIQDRTLLQHHRQQMPEGDFLFLVEEFFDHFDIIEIEIFFHEILSVTFEMCL